MLFVRIPVRNISAEHVQFIHKQIYREEDFKVKNNNQLIVVEKERSPLRVILKFSTAVFAIGAACAIAYKYIESKYRSTVLGRIDLDGDGEAIMLDTTGNGEVDTIVIDTDQENKEE